MHRVFIVGFIALFVAAFFSIIAFIAQDNRALEAEIGVIKAEANSALQKIDASDKAIAEITANMPDPTLGITISLPAVALPPPPRIRSVSGGVFGSSQVNAQIAQANSDLELQWQQVQEQLNQELRAAEMRLERQIISAESRLRTEIDGSRQQLTGIFSNVQSVSRQIQSLFERLASIKLPSKQEFLLVWLPVVISLCSAFVTFWYTREQYRLELLKVIVESQKASGDRRTPEFVEQKPDQASVPLAASSPRD